MTVAGDGTWDYDDFVGDGGLATEAQVGKPVGIALDSSGHLYIADNYNNRIRKVDSETGIITTVVGDGARGFSNDGVLAAEAQLSSLREVAFDPSGNLYFGEGYRVRRVDGATGIITTVAGNGEGGYSGDGGFATAAKLGYPSSIAFDSSSRLHIADGANHRIRRVNDNGIIVTVAGNGEAGFSGDGGLATKAQLDDPAGVAFDSSGNLYISDTGNHRIRRVDNETGIITTIAGNGEKDYSGDGGLATDAAFFWPAKITITPFGHLYIADVGNLRIRRIDGVTGIVTTVAGNGERGYSGDSLLATEASFSSPRAVTLDSFGRLYIADMYNHRIRMVELDPALSIFTHQHQFFAEMRYDSESASLLLRSTKRGQLIVTDLLGNLLLTKAIDAGESRFDLAHLPRGRYFAQCGGAVEVITKGR